MPIESLRCTREQVSKREVALQVSHSFGVVVGAEKTAILQRVWEIGVDSVLKLDRAVIRESTANRRCPAEGHFLTTIT
jgi:hypothetical protein